MKCLVFSGGGILGLSYLGILQVLHSKDLLKEFKYFSGSSIGSIFAFLCSSKATQNYIHGVMISLKFKDLKDDGPTLFHDLYRFINKFGYCKGIFLTNVIKKISFDLFQKENITFLEHYELTGNELNITGCNLTKRKTEYFNYKTSGNMLISEALRISCSFPFVYESVSCKGEIYIDGGLLDNIPIDCFNDRFKPEEILALKFISDSSEGKSLNNLKDYIEILISIIYDQAQKLHIHDANWKYILQIPVGKYSSMNFDITDEDVKILIKCGSDAMIGYLDSH